MSTSIRAHKGLKKSVYSHLAQIARGLADPGRLEILEIISQAPKSVERIAGAASMTVAMASHHLQILKQCGLAAARRSGRYSVYSVTEPGRELFSVLCRHGELYSAGIRLALKDHFGELDAEAAVERDVMRRVRMGAALLIDVRPEEEFQAGHVPGAVSVPLAELAVRMKALPPHMEVFAYCRGPFCVLAAEAVTVLRRKGFSAFRLRFGPRDFERPGRGRRTVAGRH